MPEGPHTAFPLPDKAHPQMGALLQVMPWLAYSNMLPRQVRAIYEYLSAIPPAKAAGVN